MHSYSFPTGASQLSLFNERRKQVASIPPESDVYMTRKHATFVSIFLIDIPLIVVRSIIWINYPYNPGLQPLIFKNILNIPISTYRLMQCRAAEKQQQVEAMEGKDLTPWVSLARRRDNIFSAGVLPDFSLETPMTPLEMKVEDFQKTLETIIWLFHSRWTLT
eukprot:Protomagalhaensia_sp_Gyna_25__153@NODE_1072_length_2224_cov_3_901144_g854_i0_p2_GENE_NODE_1072_length_2224_cov_3_901144_g854_i0NODE_1072_length_2224_cov_3_901144_g854_i0_p2_ORF_typecomplete_len163_score16_52CECR6_TMEM121/PF14997_6/7_6e13_NODE_1072_length_2224_cov_3_901144_g854_i05221010